MKAIKRAMIYDPHARKYESEESEDEFYCGLTLNQLAINLKLLKDGKRTLQEAYDTIVSDIIISHVIRNSQCECRDYLHELERKIAEG